MIGLRLDQAKSLFFDRQRVLASTNKAERKVLSKFGAFVRQRSRTSIRPRKGSSPPGSPPFSHTGLLRRNIFFAFDPGARSVVIGPTLLNAKAGVAPRLLEHGGTATLRRGSRLRPAVYRPRPYMRPAFETEQQKLPSLWKNSIR